MAVIYLQHPKHGAKVAISELEAENDIANGWEKFDPIQFDVEDKILVVESVNQLQSRRRGRPSKEIPQ